MNGTQNKNPSNNFLFISFPTFQFIIQDMKNKNDDCTLYGNKHRKRTWCPSQTVDKVKFVNSL